MYAKLQSLWIQTSTQVKNLPNRPSLLIATIAGVSALAATTYLIFSPYNKMIYQKSKDWLVSFFLGTKEERLLKHVLKTATAGDPQSVVSTIDSYCWSNWMMNVGDVKGRILDEAVIHAKPKVHNFTFPISNN